MRAMLITNMAVPTQKLRHADPLYPPEAAADLAVTEIGDRTLLVVTSTTGFGMNSTARIGDL